MKFHEESVVVFTKPVELLPVDSAAIPHAIISTDNIQVVNSLVEYFGKKIIQIWFHGPINDTNNLRASYRGVVKIFVPKKEQVIEHAEFLKKNRFFLCPLFPLEKWEDISLMLSMGLGVDFLYRIDDIDTPLLLRIADYYLHHSELEIPIEPFHSIFMAKLKRTALNCWLLYMRSPDRFFYADETGLAEEPEQLAEKKYLLRFHPQMEKLEKLETLETLETLSKGEPKSQLKDFLQSLPRRHPECMSCDHFNFCFGWGKYQNQNKQDTEDTEKSCEKWRQLLHLLQSNVKEIKNIINK